MCVTARLRLRASIGITSNAQLVDFFKSNTRESISIKTNFANIINVLQDFDGVTSTADIAIKHNINLDQLLVLVRYLQQEYILIDQDMDYPISLLNQNLRLINMLEDYFHSVSEVIRSILEMKNRCVLIIGCGAVGSYIALQLTKLGVSNLILVDDDLVELSNLHRQYFFENDIGLLKTSSLKRKLLEINPILNCYEINRTLTEDFFETIELPMKPDIIINCADEPSVDETSRIIAKYAMSRNIPHIVGGGYNLHLTLIGQTIIPYESACFECFNLSLNKINSVEFKNIKMLHREKRKLGSFSPLSGIAASLASLDAFKILIGRKDLLLQVNKRIEFDTQTFTFHEMLIAKNPDCSWCSQ